MRKHLRWNIPLLIMAVLCMVFLLYTGSYYRADETALSDLVSDGTVQVSQTDYGWFFDGPENETVLIFYPGGKVEETAYAPLLHRLAGEGMDVCLVKMPFRLAVFDTDKADDVRKLYNYSQWYIGGHSLGGAMAANYAAEQGEDLTGLILLAAYPTKKLPQSLTMISIYGSEDCIVDRNLIEDGRSFAPEKSFEYLITGGNHSQFGNYGEQKGDGKATIKPETQQEEAAAFIFETIETGS